MKTMFKNKVVKKKQAKKLSDEDTGSKAAGRMS